MRRLSRIDRSIDRLHPRPIHLSSSFLCSACLRRAPFSTSIQSLAESDKPARIERLRRKIWGTDEPPGLEDPYGGPSIIEKRQAARAREQSQSQEEEAPIQESITQQAKQSTPIQDASYEPAKTWDDLEEVGELPPPEFYFEGFTPTEKVTDTYEATAALHRAVVEVFTLKQAGRPLSELSNADTRADNTSDVHISVSPSDPSTPMLRYPDGSSEETILQSLSPKEPSSQDLEAVEATGSIEEGLEPGVSVEASTIESKTANDADVVDESAESVESPGATNFEQLVASWNPSWLKISLEDSEIKFAIIKRVMQLTGIRTPDSALNSAYTVRSLLTHVTQKPKPTKLFDALGDRQDLVTLPNVKIFNRRITPIDKEKMVGRWKLIEKELNSRGLPLTGHSKWNKEI